MFGHIKTNRLHSADSNFIRIDFCANFSTFHKMQEMVSFSKRRRSRKIRSANMFIIKYSICIVLMLMLMLVVCFDYILYLM